MNNFVLYLHIAPNGKKYFGITGQAPKKRWLRGKGYIGQEFYKAVEEFGWDNIKHYILADDLTRFEARMFEVMTIAIYNTRNPLYGYNDSPGGGIISEKARQKISETLKGRIFSEEHKQKISETMKGKNTGENSYLYGKTGRDHHTSKAVICITTGRCFGSTEEAARSLNLKSGSNIRKCCRGKKKSAYKSPDGEPLVWRYVADLPRPQLTDSDKMHLRDLLDKYSA